jgi:hypothetical protein
MALYHLKKTQLDASFEIYQAVGEKPFTPPQLYEKLGGIDNSMFSGFMISTLRKNKCVKVIKTDKIKDTRGWLIKQTTYQLTREVIMYMENRNMIPRKVEQRACNR